MTELGQACAQANPGALPLTPVTAVPTRAGMRPMGEQEAQAALTAKASNVKSYEPILAETKTLLQDFYRPYNKRLAAAMGGDPRWLWGY